MPREWPIVDRFTTRVFETLPHRIEIFDRKRWMSLVAGVKSSSTPRWTEGRRLEPAAITSLRTGRLDRPGDT